MSESVAALTEAQLANWTFGVPGPEGYPSPVRSVLACVLGIPLAAPALLRVSTRHLIPGATKPGDVDALLAVPGSEAQAVAFECKPVKVRPTTFATGRPNRLRELDHGAHQANALQALGFHRVYLLVAVAVDGRWRPGNPIGRGLTSGLAQVIYASLPLDALAPSVGLVVIEGVQWSSKSVYGAGGIGMPVIRDAVPQPQPPALTRAIQRYACSRPGLKWRPYFDDVEGPT